MFSLKTIVSTLLAMFTLAVASPLFAQTAAEQFLYYPAGADEFFFFEEADRKKVADFKTDKLVRVCVDDSRHTVPLRVDYDSKSTTVTPGDCFRLEAREVWLEPARELDPRWTLRAEVDTMETTKTRGS